MSREDPKPSSSDPSASSQLSRSPSALRADPALPFLEMAWSPSQLQEFLNKRVLPAGWPGQEVRVVAIDDMSYKPGKQCEILYSLQFVNPTTGQARWTAVTFADEKSLQEIYRRHYSGDGGPAARPTPRPVVFLPEYGCLVEFFPMDWKLPFLAWVVEPQQIALLLSQNGPKAEHSHWLPKVEVLRYRPHKRGVLRYTVNAPDSGDPQEVIGKVYLLGSQTVREAYVLNLLRPQAAACGIIIPKPLGVMEEWGFLLMERVPGTGLQLVMKQAQTLEQFKEVLGLIAATLVSLHSFRFESQEVRSLQAEVEKLHKRVALFHLVAPLLAQQAEALLLQIAQLGARSTTAACTFIHGGFHPDQLLMDKEQISVVDFDSSCLGDPAIDVGKFMASLRHKAVSKASDTFRQFAAYFLSEYQARLPGHRVRDRVHLFLSIYLVRRALRAFEKRPYDYGCAGPDALPALLLQEAAASLKEN